MGFFKDMSDSAINLSQYRRFADQPWGKVITYLLLMVLILGTPVLLSFVFDFNKGVGDLVGKFNENIPEFVLKDGELAVSGEMPLIIEDKSGEEKSIIVIDTSGETDGSVLDDYDTGMFISEKEAVIKQNAVEKQVFSFSAFKGGEIHKADVEKYLSYIKWVGILIVLLGLIYFFLSKLCTAVVLGLVCLLFSAIQNTRLQYDQTFKIAIYALTIPTLFQALQYILAPDFIFGWFVYYTIALFYLWFAVRVIRIKQQEESNKDVTI